MNRKAGIPAASVLLSLVCAALLFLNWNLEALFRQEETPVTISDMEMIGGTDYAAAEPVGLPARVLQTFP